MSASHGYHSPFQTQLADCDRFEKAIQRKLKGFAF
jgi:hypothetical protein